MIPIKEILRKIVKYEFKTDAGIVNFIGVILFFIFIMFLKVGRHVEQLIWRVFFHENPNPEGLFKYFLAVIIIFMVSVFCVYLGEKSRAS